MLLKVGLRCHSKSTDTIPTMSGLMIQLYLIIFSLHLRVIPRSARPAWVKRQSGTNCQVPAPHAPWTEIDTRNCSSLPGRPIRMVPASDKKINSGLMFGSRKGML